MSVRPLSLLPRCAVSRTFPGRSALDDIDGITRVSLPARQLRPV
jgi:hypothetical protein